MKIEIKDKDLARQASYEIRKTIWSVRWFYWITYNEGLTLRPPHSMVEHIGFDADATNAFDGSFWRNPPLQKAPEIPDVWPEPEENPECGALWRKACGEFYGVKDIAVYKVLIRLLQAMFYRTKTVRDKL